MHSETCPHYSCILILSLSWGYLSFFCLFWFVHLFIRTLRVIFCWSDIGDIIQPWGPLPGCGSDPQKLTLRGRQTLTASQVKEKQRNYRVFLRIMGGTPFPQEVRGTVWVGVGLHWAEGALREESSSRGWAEGFRNMGNCSWVVLGMERAGHAVGGQGPWSGAGQCPGWMVKLIGSGQGSVVIREKWVGNKCQMSWELLKVLIIILIQNRKKVLRHGVGDLDSFTGGRWLKHTCVKQDRRTFRLHMQPFQRKCLGRKIYPPGWLSVSLPFSHCGPFIDQFLWPPVLPVDPLVPSNSHFSHFSLCSPWNICGLYGLYGLWLEDTGPCALVRYCPCWVIWPMKG